MKRVALVILNWNGKRFLERFLPEVVRYSSELADIIIADNASTDDSVSFLEKTYPDIRIIKINKNRGFAGGYDYALSQVDNEYYMLLNSDIEVTQDWLNPLIELMDSDQQIAACQPKIRAYNNKKHFEYAGAAGGFIDSFGYPFCRGRIFYELEEDKGQYDDIKEIFWATGAAMFIRKELFHKLGGFDDDFFAHMEEIDLCWRLKNVGYKILYCPESTVFHIGGGTLPKNSSKKTYLNYRNNLVLLYKNLPKSRLIPVAIIRVILDFAAMLKFLFGNGFKDAFAVVKAHTYFIFRFNRIRNKRKKQIPVSFFSEIYKGSIVVDFFIKKIKRYSLLKFR